MKHPEDTFVKKVVVPAAHEGYFSDIFVEPPPKGNEDLGTLYVIAEIKSPAQDPPYIFTTICKLVKSGYWRTVGDTVVPDFEEALTHLNIFLTNLKKEGEIELVSHLNVAVIALHKSTLQISTIGNVTAIIKQRQETTKLLPAEDSELPSGSSDRFLHVITGRFSKDSVLFIATPGLFKIFNEENLLRAISQSESVPTDKIEKIITSNKSLLGNEGVTCFVLEYASSPIHRENARGSERLLAPLMRLSRVPRFGSLAAYLVRLSKSFSSPKKFAHLLISIRGNRTLLDTRKYIPARLPRVRLRPIVLLASAPKVRHFAALALLFVAVIIIGNILLKPETPQRDEQQISALIEKVEQKQREAENFLIFDDKKSAKESFLEARSLLATFSLHESAKELNRYEEEITRSLDEIQGVIPIESPHVLLDVSNLPLGFTPQGVFRIGPTLYVLAGKNQLLYYLNLDTDERRVTILSPELKDAKPALAASFENATLLILNQHHKRITRYGPEGEVQRSERVVIPEEIEALNTLGSYNNNIYGLDPKTGTIVRYRVEPEQISGPSYWLQNDERLRDARDIAIDGSLYLINREGNVLVYAQGSLRTTWDRNSTLLSDTINSIYTFDGARFVYILDPKSKKLALLSQDGKLVKQYRSEAFDNLIDVFVAPDETKAYILNGEKVFEIELK